MEFLERQFRIREKGSTVKREILAGVVTFMTMAYIIFVNPLILVSAGMPREAAMAATCLGAALPTFLMGWFANVPIALASGMGLNAAVAFHAMTPGMNWQTMMGVVVLEGAFTTILVLTPWRESIFDAIPLALKKAMGVGIGFFIAFLGLQNMGWIQKGVDGVFLTHAPFDDARVILATVGFLALLGFYAWKGGVAIILGIFVTTLLAIGVDVVAPGAEKLVPLPEGWVAWPDFSTFGQADFLAALKPSLWGLIFALMMTDFFDTMGTLFAVGGQAGLLDEEGKFRGLKRVLLVDSLAAVWGGVCGASSVTTFIESGAGTSQGGRTGLVAVVVSVLFLGALFFSPIFLCVPGFATAPVLLFVGYLMSHAIGDLPLGRVEEGVPCFLMILMIPLTQSISHGLGVGILVFLFFRWVKGEGKQTSIWLNLIGLLFFLQFLWEARISRD